MIIPMTSSAQLCLHECVCVAVAESVRSSSVNVYAKLQTDISQHVQKKSGKFFAGWDL